MLESSIELAEQWSYCYLCEPTVTVGGALLLPRRLLTIAVTDLVATMNWAD